MNFNQNLLNNFPNKLLKQDFIQESQNRNMQTNQFLDKQACFKIYHQNHYDQGYVRSNSKNYIIDQSGINNQLYQNIHNQCQYIAFQTHNSFQKQNFNQNYTTQIQQQYLKQNMQSYLSKIKTKNSDHQIIPKIKNQTFNQKLILNNQIKLNQQRFFKIIVQISFFNESSNKNPVKKKINLQIKKKTKIKVQKFISMIKYNLINCLSQKQLEKASKNISQTFQQQINYQTINNIITFHTTKQEKDIQIDLILSLMKYQLQPNFFQVLHQNHQQICSNKILYLQPLKILKKPQNHKESLNDYQIIQFIGSGGFSNVYLARNIYTNIYCALKLLLKQEIQEKNASKIIQIEKVTLQSLNHPFITNIYSNFETEYFHVFAIQYCPGGQLFTRLRKVIHMSEQNAKFYFLQILLALNHMHQKGIIYRDIKPQNILIDMYGNLRLADFGLSKNIKRQKIAYSYCGSPQYMAPQMLKVTGHDYMLDYYCAGCLLYELVYSAPPFYSRNVQKIFNSVIKNQISFPSTPKTSNQFKDFIKKLLHKNPQQRLGRKNIFEILQHPFLQNNCSLKKSIANQNFYEDKLSYKEKLLKCPPFIPQPFSHEIIVSSGQDQGQQDSDEMIRIKKYNYLLQKQISKRNQINQNKNNQFSFTKKGQQSSSTKQMKNKYLTNLYQQTIIQTDSNQIKTEQFNYDQKRDQNNQQYFNEPLSYIYSDLSSQLFLKKQNNLLSNQQLKYQKLFQRQNPQGLFIPKLQSLNKLCQNKMIEEADSILMTQRQNITQRKSNTSQNNANKDKYSLGSDLNQINYQEIMKKMVSDRKDNINQFNYLVSDINFACPKKCDNKVLLNKRNVQNNLQSNLLYFNLNTFSPSYAIKKSLDGQRIHFDGSLSNFKYFNNKNHKVNKIEKIPQISYKFYQKLQFGIFSNGLSKWAYKIPQKY